MKMTVNFAYPTMVQVARKWDYHLGTGMYTIVPLEDDEKGFNHYKSDAQLVINKRTGAWEHSYYNAADDVIVKNGRGSKSLESYLSRYGRKNAA